MFHFFILTNWKTVKVITNLHTLNVFHFKSEFQSKCKPLLNDKTIIFRLRVKWKPGKQRNCRKCTVVIYSILITTRNAKSHSVTSKTRICNKNSFVLAGNQTSKVLLVCCGICIVMLNKIIIMLSQLEALVQMS